MSGHNRVMWSEGMFLLPQHFQYQDEYHQHQLAEFGHRTSPFHWGVQQIEIDEDALAQGVLAFRRVKLVFPDGTLYDAPQHDPLPASRDLNALTRESRLTVHAALRQVEPYAVNCAEDAHDARATNPRFRRHFAQLPDVNEGTPESELTLMPLNVVILIEGDSLDGYTHCALTALSRVASGGFGVERRFVPPVMHLQSHDELMTIVRRLTGALMAKHDAIGMRRRERADQVAEFGSGDISLFWLLHTVNRVYPQLAHLLAHPQLPPERLYRVIADLAGSLMTFSMQYRLTDIPDYDHKAPAISLYRLDEMVRELLDTVIPDKYIPIALEQTKPSYYLGRLHDARLVDADFYIAVHADMPGSQLLELVPRAFKVGSPEDIEVVVNSAMPGGLLAHAPRLPPSIPVRLDNHYFALEPNGAMYDRMMAAHAIAFYVPSGFQNLKIELMAVLK